jgi:hypothetical protein
MRDGVSSMQSFFVHLCDEFQNRLIPLLKRIHHLFLPMTDCTLRALTSTHIGVFGMRLKWMEKAKQTKLGPNRLLLVGFLAFAQRTAESLRLEIHGGGDSSTREVLVQLRGIFLGVS